MKKALCFAAVSAGAWVAGTAIASAQEAPPPTDQPASRPHTVVAGESLSKISQAELGASGRWVEIFALNRGALANPDVIEVGQVLAIPTAPVAVPTDLVAAIGSAPTPAPTARRQSATSARPTATHTHTRATSAPRATRSGGGAGGSMAAIRACESGGNYGAVSANGRYRGAYQFDRQTWQSVGGTGDPAAASPAEQDARASRLRSQRGSNPWPSCG